MRYDKDTGIVKIIPMPESSSREVYSSSRDWVLDIRRSQEKGVLENQTFPTTIKDRQLACKILEYAAFKGLRRESITGPFPLHHPDLHHKKKNWKEYLLEFVMIFLAVTLGFFAENIQEHFYDEGKTKVFATSLYQDFKADSVSLVQLINYTNEKITTID